MRSLIMQSALSFNTFMNNLSDKDYMTATAPEGNNINLKMIYLNHRNETNKELDRSLKELWVEYFNSRRLEPNQQSYLNETSIKSFNLYIYTH